MVDPLLSLRKLTHYGCPVTFVDNTVTVTNPDGVVILVGRKLCGRNIYTVPLPKGLRPRVFPSTITLPAQATAPKISGIQANHIKPITETKLSETVTHNMTIASPARTKQMSRMTSENTNKQAEILVKTTNTPFPRPQNTKNVITRLIRELEAF